MTKLSNHSCFLFFRNLLKDFIDGIGSKGAFINHHVESCVGEERFNFDKYIHKPYLIKVSSMGEGGQQYSKA